MLIRGRCRRMEHGLIAGRSSMGGGGYDDSNSGEAMDVHLHPTKFPSRSAENSLVFYDNHHRKSAAFALRPPELIGLVSSSLSLSFLPTSTFTPPSSSELDPLLAEGLCPSRPGRLRGGDRDREILRSDAELELRLAVRPFLRGGDREILSEGLRPRALRCGGDGERLAVLGGGETERETDLVYDRLRVGR